MRVKAVDRGGINYVTFAIFPQRSTGKKKQFMFGQPTMSVIS